MHAASNLHDLQTLPRFQNTCALPRISVMRDIQTIGAFVPRPTAVVYSLAYACIQACHKLLQKRNDAATLTVGFGFALKHLCKKCAAPIVQILEHYKLITSKA
jgi:hypothetical protein